MGNEVGSALPLRVLFVNPIGGLGGAEQSLLDLLAALRTTPNLELSLLLLEDGPLRERMEDLGIRVDVLPMPESLATLGEFGLSGTKTLGRAVLGGIAGVRYFERLSHALRTARADIVHTNGIKAHWLVCALRRGPTVLHFRDFVKERPLTRSALRPLCALGPRVAIGISQAVGRELEAAFPSLDTEVVYDGIDTDALCPGPTQGATLAELAELLPDAPGTLSVGILGTYARWKGHDYFLRAAAEVSRRHPDRSLRFYLIGGPIYKTRTAQFTRAELEGLAAELGIHARVGFIPFRSDVLHLYRSLDIVVHASTQPEPFGRTIVEAMACGRAVIAMRDGGARELFEDGIHALGADPCSAPSLAGAMARLIEQPDLRGELAARAREHAVARFSRTRLPNDMLRVYARVSGRGP